jgi:magnesium-protoporphyrin O-methyltransferase
LVGLARERMPSDLRSGQIEFQCGDMLDPAWGQFDHVVGMDSLIHYRAEDVVRVLAGLGDRTDDSLLFTFAPKTPALAVMHAVGRLFPRGDRAPAIEPVAEPRLHKLLAREPRLAGWQPNRTERIASSFYKSQALELIRK